MKAQRTHIILLALFLMTGCTTQPAQESGSRVPVVRNTWFEEYRPTDVFMNLDGQWDVVTITGNRENLWKKPDSPGGKIELPQIEGSRFRERIIPRSKEVMLNWYTRSFVPDEEIQKALADGNEIFMHFGGVSWRWSAWLNGQLLVDASYEVFNSIQVDVSSILIPDRENTITIAATDNHGLAENLRHAKLFEPEVTAERDGDFVAPAPET